MKKTRIVTTVLLLAIPGLCLVGCSDKFIDPMQVGRFRPVPAVNVILDSLGVAEETPSTWEGAEDPRPIDVMAFETDYVFSPGDVVRIFIFELTQDGVPFVNTYMITETGNISIPEVGIIPVSGLTEAQLEEEIKDILSPSILKEPLVSVALMSSQKYVYSILGNGVPAPGRYSVPRYDFRLTDALATARVATQFNVSYIYVSRAVTGKEPVTEPLEPEIPEPQPLEQLIPPEREMMEIIAPRAQRQHSLSDQESILASSEMVTHKELAELALPQGFEPPHDVRQQPDDEPIEIEEENESPTKWVFKDGKWVQVKLPRPKPKVSAVKAQPHKAGADAVTKTPAPEIIDEPIDKSRVGRIEWIFQDGRWIPVQVGRPPEEPEPEEPVEPLKQKLPEEFGWEQIETGGVQRRVIKIPTDKLSSGDPRYNIVIRPGDTIHVPVDIIGEFCIIGNTNAQGFIPLTGRPMTLKMAIAAAGGFGPLAWPKRCEVVRRISKKKEETVMVDLDKIYRGEQPDFFIKPNDLINVGTHPTARWRAVLRNAFRATYGFGFIYDRNFSDRDYGTRRPIPQWF